MSNLSKKYEKEQQGTIGYRLKQLRTKYNLSQEDVANACFISRQTLSSYEWNNADIKTDFIEKFIDLIKKQDPLCDIAPEYLINLKHTSLDRKNVSINKRLGLSDKSIKNIEAIYNLYRKKDLLNKDKINNPYTDILNLLLETDSFIPLIKNIHNLALTESNDKEFLNWKLENVIKDYVKEFMHNLQNFN